MKVPYVCVKCGKRSEFETEGKKVSGPLLESKEVDRTLNYIVYCSHCGATNSVEVNHGKWHG